MSNKIPKLTIVQASALLGLEYRQGHRLLTAVHAKHPGLRLLFRPGYKGTGGNYDVNPHALRRLMLDDEGMLLNDTVQRVGYLESDLRSITIRVGGLEKSTKGQKACSKYAPASR
jgi:hypothetical protein